MGSGTGLIQYKNKSEYLAKKPALSKAALPKTELLKPLERAATKSQVSDQAKEAAKNITDLAQKLPPTPPVSVIADIIPEIIPDIEAAEEAVEVVEEKPIEKIQPAQKEKIKDSPAIIFITGLSISSSSGDGLEDMASAIPKSEVYSWGDKDDVIESILKRPKSQPVMIVGHSLGADTAVEVAQELNQVEYGFRKVDLLVTLDSVGFNNDIIPQNVRSNLNFIGDDWYGINDSPNIARNTEYSEVLNELREDSHRGIENNEEVQLKIFEKLEALLKNSEAQRTVGQLSSSAHKNLKGISLQ